MTSIKFVYILFLQLVNRFFDGSIILNFYVKIFIFFLGLEVILNCCHLYLYIQSERRPARKNKNYYSFCSFQKLLTSS